VEARVARLLILTPTPERDVLPALALLRHEVRSIHADPASLVDAPESDVIVVDATADLLAAKSLCAILNTTGVSAPVLLAVDEGGMTAVNPDWHVDDFVRAAAGPAELDARIRLARTARTQERVPLRTSGITIDEETYSAKALGKPLDLTFTEFELLRFLASHPARVFSREQLLSEVWGHDYFGGPRTVDVHIRRLRAKLGDLESLIGTVRNVGYRFIAVEEGGEHADHAVTG
jgi:DNA-binding response OmpR family regulator